MNLFHPTVQIAPKLPKLGSSFPVNSSTDVLIIMIKFSKRINPSSTAHWTDLYLIHGQAGQLERQLDSFYDEATKSLIKLIQIGTIQFTSSERQVLETVLAVVDNSTTTLCRYESSPMPATRGQKGVLVY
jgi:hypothetical protein